MSCVVKMSAYEQGRDPRFWVDPFMRIYLQVWAALVWRFGLRNMVEGRLTRHFWQRWRGATREEGNALAAIGVLR
jgi:hypothetical protein